uniref:Uncharacterized protein n=1 Tax=Plectus sambesii TaxID=2011161 RepID=A0A914WNR1_9BILA
MMAIWLLAALAVSRAHQGLAPVFAPELDDDSVVHMQAPSSADACQLPPEWSGRWFLNEHNQPLKITTTSISLKGRCVATSESGYGQAKNYLFKLETKNDVCWRCMVFFFEHHNVLQFKESRCSRTGSAEMISQICSGFNGDDPMMTLFRADAHPQPCPIDAPANFTYRDMKGSCRSRMSTIDACASNSKLRLRFQACPEITYSESQVDDIECIGAWEYHNSRYFAAKLVNHPALFEGEKYRCFMYEKQSDGGRVGISADAACRGLIGVDSASTVIDYKIDSYPTAQCTFPSFLRHYHAEQGGGQKKWESVATSDIHRITADEWVEGSVASGENRSTAVCIQEEDLGKTHRIVVYLVSGCSRGYQCIKVHRRDEQVIEVVRGLLAPNALEACSEEYIDEHLMTYDTLLLAGSVEQHCPNHGRYKIHGCDQDNAASYYFGCSAKHQLIVNKQCRPNETGTIVLLTRALKTIGSSR